MDYSLSYWRLAGGGEVDFIVNDMEMAIEAKAVSQVTSDHLKGLRSLHEDHPKVKARILVCLEAKERRTEDGIRILPARAFCDWLWGGMSLIATQIK
jgi:predicted AAA+ superfamily ATPase